MVKKILFLSIVGLSFFYKTLAQDVGKVQINRGSRYTRTHIVTLNLAGFNVDKMMISNHSDFRDAHWLSYTPKIYGWSLNSTPGEQTVYVKFKSKDMGKVSDPISDAITLDATAPTNGSIKIDVPDGTLNQVDSIQTVDLKLNCTDAAYMILSNSRSFFRKRWQTYKPDFKDWVLSNSADGEKMIFAKYRDKAGNISEIAMDKIIIDTQGPFRTKILINNDEEFTADSTGKVIITAVGTGVTQIKLSNTNDFSSTQWQPFKKQIPWQLPKGDGAAVVYAIFKDASNNQSKGMDSIIVDTTPPQKCSIVINEGDEVTRQPDGIVELSLKASEEHQVLISNYKDFRGAYWTYFEDLVTNWRLEPGMGKRTVYIKFKDEAGNISPVYTDDILLQK
ncbi:MAG: hypothetical protein EAZ57_01700 [Cytophagales bacterium]|nr:MAG: hypothetical protein EAZ67_01570 [Cytophagales bacterium]TAF62163.1 MAG: hypothetical protein EAZ57_01700 [Cytophagales bacterium]